MQVILLERIGKLGQMGDVVTVKDGYARNFLLPKGKALRATQGNLERFEQDRSQLEARNLELKKEAEAVFETLDGASFVVIRQAGDTGQLYGSVSTRDISDLVTEGGFTIERQQVMLDRPIKALGLHPVRVSLHPEVESLININVARSEEEAERQARGEDVTVLVDEDEEDMDEAISAEEVFEDEDLAREAQEVLEQEVVDDTEGTEAEQAAEPETPSEGPDQEDDEDAR